MDRLELQKKFIEILGSKNVYFQPPSNTKMEYPAIRYKLDDIPVSKADNKIYFKTHRYAVTHIYKSLKNELTDTMLDSFQFISFSNRSYDDGLYNDSYELYW